MTEEQRKRRAWRAHLRRAAKRAARVTALIDAALAMPCPRLVLAKRDRPTMLLHRSSYGEPYRITFIDAQGPSGHLEFKATDRHGFASLDQEIAGALASGYRVRP